MTIAPITNGEAGSSVRAKLNEVIEAVSPATPPTVGHVLTSNGASDPTFQAVPGGGGGSTVTLTASGSITAGTAVSINSSGLGVQTWGPAPQPGSTVTVLTAPLLYWGILQLDANNFVIFNDKPEGQPSGAISVSISGGVITPGTFLADPLFLGVVSGNYNSCNPNGLPTGNAVGLTASSFVVAYPDSVSGFVQVRAGSISGGVITMGSAVQVDANAFNAGTPISTVKLSAGSFALAFSTGSGSEIVIGSVAANVVTLGAPVVLAAATAPPLLGAFSATKVLVVYPDAGNSQYMTAVIATVAALVVTLGTPVATPFPASLNTVLPPPLIVDATHWTSTWWESPSDIYSQYLAAGSFTGTVPTWGAPVKVAEKTNGANANLPQNISMGLLDSTHVVVLCAYANLRTAIYALAGTALTLTVQNEASGRLPNVINPSDNTALFNLPATVAVVSSSQYMFSDSASDLFAASPSGLVSPVVPHPGTQAYWVAPVDTTQILASFMDDAGNLVLRLVHANPISSGPLGFTASAVTNGNPITVVTAGPCAGFTGLTPGTYYYVNGDGTLTTANTGHPGGFATSTTQLTIAAAP
jgi:hypothetical protein